VFEAETLLRTGVRPDGQRTSTAMLRNKHLSDTALAAMYLYLKSIQSDLSGF
jgi:hypothetical protein